MINNIKSIYKDMKKTKNFQNSQVQAQQFGSPIGVVGGATGMSPRENRQQVAGQAPVQ